MNKPLAIFAMIFAAILLVANLILVYDGIQVGTTKWGNICGAIAMVFVFSFFYSRYKNKSKE